MKLTLKGHIFDETNTLKFQKLFEVLYLSQDNILRIVKFQQYPLHQEYLKEIRKVR